MKNKKIKTPDRSRMSALSCHPELQIGDKQFLKNNFQKHYNYRKVAIGLGCIPAFTHVVHRRFRVNHISVLLTLIPWGTNFISLWTSYFIMDRYFQKIGLYQKYQIDHS